MMRRLLAGSLLVPFTVAMFVLFPLAAYGASSGPNSPSSCVNATGIGTVAWTNPGNAVSSNDSDATASLFSSAVSNYLKCTSFGFSIPSGATIDGILVEIERSSQSGFVTIDNRISIVKADGTIGTTNKSAGATWPTSDAYASFGGSSDLWGETWTDTDINDTDFGAVLAAQGNTFGLPAPDHFRITVYYTESGGGGGGTTQTQVRVISVF